MYIGELVSYYFLWHYTRSFVDLWRITRNFLWFFWNLFSIPLLARTIFAPWRRIIEREAGARAGGRVAAHLLNGVARAAGFLIRSGTILLGLAAVACTLAVSAAFLLAWIFFPLILLGLLSTGIAKLFS